MEIEKLERKIRMKRPETAGFSVLASLLGLLVFLSPADAKAQMSAADELARKLANPLANIHAILYENDVFFFNSENGKNKGELYSFQLKPVWAVDVEEEGYSVIFRAIIPLNGRFRSVTDNFGRIWGLGDMGLEIFIAPKTSSTWKWGIGPQFSFETRSQPQLGGTGYGIGLTGVIVGSISSQISLALLANQAWSLDSKHSIASIQPFLSYHFRSVPGLHIHYRQATTINWKTRGAKVNLPIGVGIGRTWAFGDRGYGFDFNFGIYFYPIREDGAPLWSLKVDLGLVWP
jgi:hypothetical protein